jgi:hypothetical protein
MSAVRDLEEMIGRLLEAARKLPAGEARYSTQTDRQPPGLPRCRHRATVTTRQVRPPQLAASFDSSPIFISTGSLFGKKQKNVQRHEINAKGDQYVFVAMAGTQKAIISWGVGKKHGLHHGFPARLARPRDRLAGDFNRWLSSLPRSDP